MGIFWVRLDSITLISHADELVKAMYFPSHILLSP